MASGTNYSQIYEQAEQAYTGGDFTHAAEIIDRLADEFPEDPNVLLLRGHIYCYGFQDYNTARQLYREVLELTQERDLLDIAYGGLEEAERLQEELSKTEVAFDEYNFDLEAEGSAEDDFADAATNLEFDESISESSDARSDFDSFSLPNSEELELSEEEPDTFADFNSSTEIAKEPSRLDDADSAFEAESEAEYSADNFTLGGDEVFGNFGDREKEIDETEALAVNSSEFDTGDLDERAKSNSQDELEFDEIDSSFFDLEELEQGLPDTGLFNVSDDVSSSESVNSAIATPSEIEHVSPSEVVAESSIDTNSSNSSIDLEPQVDVKQGLLAGFANASIQKKQLILAGVTGVVTTVAVLGISLIGNDVSNTESENTFASRTRNSVLMSLVAGVVSCGTAAVVGSVTAKQVNQASQNLQSQFEDVYRGNLNAKATVYATDELGKLASGFNRMTRVILTTTQEAQRRAEETEQAKEDLQRQVIRLLDDVEGAARGDLTVQATVTADVLGAVADAFNLTIQSLREIVRQVKEAAEQVNQSSTDSELFARNQSSEALRMAEELAVTLNSVKMMTESFERVADNAREAEEVARSSSVTALKGGKAVERTVAGIFQIRETVSETARKVKRLAEASQEISKIVLLISQIAERTNQLALNASIQAAKAGEAGRGFAVVADEVRQLADRSGKSLKEIEQIVLQIQSETGSVMTAMEEGIQEVIDVTDRADQAKTALEDIIQVSNRIDTLVRSITADTVEQRENSRAVAQVMQSVELTAQATSQESQRVAGALQSLVGIARSLLSSVERFRIDKSEE
ncbi:HAMP domain-containing methyl-accepting chemotaxis protein [Myxosarcina sp. GI1]|uniref:methyl-accepting chemotaxis protein n=1 Tax=Myxosarcina sp. GI1 TaxID=1541065 RepID=UPI000564EF76|nr:HAMP domain-containing methyl-accepting chemotaxis protein [Myxosarcina sp. GI1]